MSKRLTITFPNNHDHFFYSRVLDFGEALYGHVVNAHLGVLCDLDTFTNVVWIKFAHPHNLGKLKGTIRKQLDRFQLSADAIIS